MKLPLILFPAVVALAACSHFESKPPPVTEAQLQSALATQQQALNEIQTRSCMSREQLETVQREHDAQLETVSKQLTELQREISKVHELASVPPQMAAEPKALEEAICPTESISDMVILGEVEAVYVAEVERVFDTRIDTGAESSSLDALGMELFERDGDTWVRFGLRKRESDAEPVMFEYPVEKFVWIKQAGIEQPEKRPVIHAHLKIGKYRAETELNLSDRSHLDYPLLLGRKFIKDIALVDVSQRYIHGKPEALRQAREKLKADKAARDQEKDIE